MAEIKPIIKWAGGKRKLAPEIISHFGKYRRYFEPFAGGASVMLELSPKDAVISDINSELITMYDMVKNYPEELCQHLEAEYVPYQSAEFYYYVRNKDREPGYLDNESKENLIDRAARFIFLNKTGFNGLWRENVKGQNNVSFGKYANPCVLDSEGIISLSKMLNENNISLLCQDYRTTLKDAGNNDLVYMDPPYDVEEGHNGFTAYSKSGFNRKNQVELKSVADQLLNVGCKVFISNADTGFIRDLYGNDSRYVIHEMRARRNIGRRADSRKEITELLIEGRVSNSNNHLTKNMQKIKYKPKKKTNEKWQRALI